MRRLPLCLVLALAPQTAAAQAPRYPRAQPAPPVVTLSARVKPVTAPPAATAAAMPGPSVALAKLLELEPIAAARPEQEQILAQLIENTPDSDVDEKSDYYFRLAMLYANQLRFWIAKTTELTALAAKKTNAADAAKVSAQAAQAANQAKMHLLKAVKAFKGLTDNEQFRNYPKMDLALFQYGYALQSGKYMKEARAVYDKLLKNFPNSIHVPYAHLVFGEYYFEAGQLADAEARYKQVLKFPKSNAYWYAFYKLGWIHMGLQRYQEALESFAQIVFATRSDSKVKYLHDAARGDFVLAYAHIGKTDKAFEAFSRIDKEAAPDLVLALADAARERGSIENAVSSYRQLLARAPKDGRVCTWQYRVAHGTLALPTATTADKLREIESLVDVYLRHRAELVTNVARAGAAANGAAVDATLPGEDLECRGNAEAMAGELAVAYHSEWSKTGNTETLDAALRLYTKYVTAFPSEGTRNAAFAEAAWSRAALETGAKLRASRWEQAATAFATLDTFEGAHAAARAWLNALDYVAPADGRLSLARTPAKAPKPLALGPSVAKQVAALTAYITQATTARPITARPTTARPTTQAPASSADDAQVIADDLVLSRLALATTLRKHRRFDDATAVLDQFLADHPDDAHAELAANLLLDSMVQAKSPNLGDVVAAMLADRAFIAGKVHLVKNLSTLQGRVARR